MARRTTTTLQRHGRAGADGARRSSSCSGSSARCRSPTTSSATPCRWCGRRGSASRACPTSSQDQLGWGAGPRAVQFLILGGQGPGPVARPHARHLRRHPGAGQAGAAAPPGAELHRRERRRHARPARSTGSWRSPPPAKTSSPAMHDSKRFLHPEAIKRIARLDLRARHVVEGFLSGMHRSPYFGQSVEFRQHRQYTYGDDLALRRLEGLGQAGPLLRQAVRGGHQPPRHAAGRRLRQHALRPRADEQVRVRLHHRRQPGLPAAAAAGRRGLRGLRRRRCG